jgi:peptidoglycan hydrolase-like protein with peptidoglycan-binding domain
MTPRQAQVALLSFVLLAGGVAYNALYTQGDAGGSRRTAVESTGHRADDRARTAQVPPADKPAAQADATQADATRHTTPGKSDVVTGALPDEPGAETVRAIQRRLGEQGFGPVPSDGMLRPVTRAAIMAYEHDQNLPLTGEANDALHARLLLKAPATSGVSGAREVRSSHAEAVVKQVQKLLVANGYRPGAIDGRLGPGTVAAIRLFERAQAMTPPKGRVSAELLLKLQEASGRLKAAEVR